MKCLAWKFSWLWTDWFFQELHSACGCLAVLISRRGTVRFGKVVMAGQEAHPGFLPAQALLLWLRKRSYSQGGRAWIQLFPQPIQWFQVLDTSSPHQCQVCQAWWRGSMCLQAWEMPPGSILLGLSVVTCKTIQLPEKPGKPFVNLY